MGLMMTATSSQDVWVYHLHQCENPNNVVKVLDSNDKYSYGYVQFQMSSWLSYGKEFGATKDNIGDKDLQIQVAEDMLNKGLWRHWRTCATKVTKKYGAYPSSAL